MPVYKIKFRKVIDRNKVGKILEERPPQSKVYHDKIVANDEDHLLKVIIIKHKLVPCPKDLRTEDRRSYFDSLISVEEDTNTLGAAFPQLESLKNK